MPIPTRSDKGIGPRTDRVGVFLMRVQFCTVCLTAVVFAPLVEEALSPLASRFAQPMHMTYASSNPDPTVLALKWYSRMHALNSVIGLPGLLLLSKPHVPLLVRCRLHQKLPQTQAAVAVCVQCLPTGQPPASGFAEVCAEYSLHRFHCNLAACADFSPFPPAHSSKSPRGPG
jgi:hypothetical protein